MPVQKTFTLIPAPPSRDVSPAIPTAGRPQIMTSKQVKAAHKAANKGPKLSRAEQRQLEKAEQARIRKEFEKEKASAKARLLRDKKKDKEEAEKAEKKKKGLPTVKIRPSQGMIAGWVRGKKRDSEGSVVENTKVKGAEKEGQDKVLVAVMEEDERSSKEVSLAAQERRGHSEDTTIPHRCPGKGISTEAGSLPRDGFVGILSQPKDLDPPHDHDGFALKPLQDCGRTSSHESSKAAPTTTIIEQLPTGFYIDLDDLDPAILEDWKPSDESNKGPQPPDPHAVDLGLSSPRRRGSSPEHNERPSTRLGRQISPDRQHLRKEQSLETPLDKATHAEELSLTTNNVERTGCDNRSQTANGQPPHTTSMRPEQPAQLFEDKAPPTPDGPTETKPDASIVEILSGDFDFDDDLLEDLAFTRSIVTSKPTAEVPTVSLNSGQDTFEMCSQDFRDVEILEALHRPTQRAQVEGAKSQDGQDAYAVRNKQQEASSSDDYGDFDDDITLSQLPPITPRPQPVVTTSIKRTSTAARQCEPTTPVPGSRRGPTKPPPLPRSVVSRSSDNSAARQLPPPSTQAIMLNPEDFFPTSSQQALELEDDSPQLPQRAPSTTPKAVLAPSFIVPALPNSKKKQKPSPQQAPPPPSSPPPRFFTSSGSRSRHSLKMLQERRARDREELRKMEERRLEKGRIEAEKRRLERAQRRQEEERWKQNHEQKRRQEEAKKLQLQRAYPQPSNVHAGTLKRNTGLVMAGLSDKENVNPVGKVLGGRELDNGVITGSMINELVSASQESFGGDWVDDLEVDLTFP